MNKVLMVLAAMVVLVAGCSRDPMNKGVVTQQPSAAPTAYVVVTTNFDDTREVIVCDSMRQSLNERSHGFTTPTGGFTYAVSLPPIGGGKYRATQLATDGEDGILLLTEAGDLIASDNIHLQKVGNGCCGTGLSCGRIWALL